MKQEEDSIVDLVLFSFIPNLLDRETVTRHHTNKACLSLKDPDFKN